MSNTRDGANLVKGSWRSGIMLVLVAVAGLMAFLWPLFFNPGSSLTTASLAPIVFTATLPVLLAVVISEMSSSSMDVKGLAMLGVLTAIGAVARPLGAGTAGLETVFFLIIMGGRVFGPGFGFVLGNTTLFTSALITGGFGPWLPHQMLAAGFVGFGAGLLPKLMGKAEVLMLAVYGFLIAHVYGILMDFAFWPFGFGSGELGYQPGAPILENLHRFFVVNITTALGWNTGRSIMNVLLISTLGPPVLQVLRRASRKAAFDSPEPAQQPDTTEQSHPSHKIKPAGQFEPVE